MRIELLADHQDKIPEIARWHWDEWGHHNPNGSYERTFARLSHRLHRDQLPIAYLALIADRVVGTASLVEFDMDSREDLSPWLAGVFVDPDYRQQGIASRLVERVCEKGRRLGFGELFLYTNSAHALYTALGWTDLGEERYRGRMVTIMKYVLR
jgi:predicted N-acetyltransferase YhbS